MEPPHETRCVLFVSPGPSISNPASGEGTRLKHLSRGLAERGWDVLALVPNTSADAVPWIRETYTYEQWSMPFLLDLNPDFLTTLTRVLRRESVDIVHLSNGTCAAAILTRIVGSSATVTYAAQNVEAAHARDFVNPDLPIYKRLLGPRLIPLLERFAVHCADKVTTVSEKDRDEFIDRYPIEERYIRAIPTGTQPVSREELRPRHEVRRDLALDIDQPVAVFHGSYAHPPNAEAVDIIVNEIASSEVIQELGIQFLLVGRGMPSLERENVTVAGFVDDLFSTLNAADFAVVPIRHGGGTKTKVYDYLSLGLPMVTTEKGIEGIDLEDGTHVLVADSAEDGFLHAIRELAQDEARRKQLRRNLRDLAEGLSWDRSVASLDDFYRP